MGDCEGTSLLSAKGLNMPAYPDDVDACRSNAEALKEAESKDSLDEFADVVRPGGGPKADEVAEGEYGP